MHHPREGRRSDLLLPPPPHSLALDVKQRQPKKLTMSAIKSEVLSPTSLLLYPTTDLNLSGYLFSCQWVSNMGSLESLWWPGKDPEAQKWGLFPWLSFKAKRLRQEESKITEAATVSSLWDHNSRITQNVKCFPKTALGENPEAQESVRGLSALQQALPGVVWGHKLGDKLGLCSIQWGGSGSGLAQKEALGPLPSTSSSEKSTLLRAAWCFQCNSFSRLTIHLDLFAGSSPKKILGFDFFFFC